MNGTLIRTTIIQERTGLTHRQIDYAVRQGFITPTREAHGSGTHRLWSENDLMACIQAKALIDAGFVAEVAWARARDLVCPCCDGRGVVAD